MYFFLTGCERDSLQEKVRSLQETCSELLDRIHQMDSQISETKVCLDKEKAKYNSACRQQEVSVVARVTEWLLQEVILPVVRRNIGHRLIWFDPLFACKGHQCVTKMQFTHS